MSDWYNMPRKDVEKKGRRLFSIYPTLAAALGASYPDYPWDKTRFLASNRTPNGYWRDHSHFMEGLEKVASKLGMEKVRTRNPFPLPSSPNLRKIRTQFLSIQPEDWHSVTLEDFKAAGMTGVTRQRLVAALAEKHPSHDWTTIFQRGKLSQQKKFERAVTALFPVCTIPRFTYSTILTSLFDLFRMCLLSQMPEEKRICLILARDSI